jgi:DnaK suppressor protein
VEIANGRAKHVLQAELDAVLERIHAEARVPNVMPAGGDFLDVAQDVERQELIRLSASRLSERATRLHIALTRISSGEYGLCSECGTAIAPKRLRAIPDVTTCMACQERLERAAR